MVGRLTISGRLFFFLFLVLLHDHLSTIDVIGRNSSVEQIQTARSCLLVDLLIARMRRIIGSMNVCLDRIDAAQS